MTTSPDALKIVSIILAACILFVGFIEKVTP